ncbi:MAG: hypothetical protein ABW187_06595, partial [Dokdonella sp.]
AVLLILIVLRPLFRNLVGPQRTRGNLQLAPGGSAVMEPMGDSLTLTSLGPVATPPVLAFEQKIELAKRVAGQEQMQVALVVKTWVAEVG